MIIGSIQNGLVIDHIPAGHGMKLYNYLGLADLDCEIALIEKAPSEKHGRKDILKIGDLIELNHDILGFMNTGITVNVIKDGERVEKIHPELPERISQMVVCKNPRCITSIEQDLPQVARLTDREKVTYRCVYCETKSEL